MMYPGCHIKYLYSVVRVELNDTNGITSIKIHNYYHMS